MKNRSKAVPSQPLWLRQLRVLAQLPGLRVAIKRFRYAWKKLVCPVLKPVSVSLRILWWFFLPFLILLSFLSWALSRCWNLVSNHKIFATMVAVGISSIIAGIFHVYTNIQSQYAEIESDLRNMVNAYETQYSFCHNVIANPHQLTYFEKRRISVLNDRLNLTLANLNDHRITLGKLTNLKTYLTLHGIACWVNTILSRSIYICSADLMSKNKMDAWRDRVIAQVISDKELHQTFYYKYIKDPFDYYFGNDPSNEIYKNPGCNLKKLNKEIRNIKLSKKRPLPSYCQFNTDYQLICSPSKHRLFVLMKTMYH